MIPEKECTNEIKKFNTKIETKNQIAKMNKEGFCETGVGKECITR